MIGMVILHASIAFWSVLTVASGVMVQRPLPSDLEVATANYNTERGGRQFTMR